MSSRGTGSPEHFPFVRRLSFRLRIEREVERLTGEQFAVRNTLGAIACDRDDAGVECKLVPTLAKPVRGESDQRLTGRRSRQSEIAFVEVRRGRLTAGRRPLVGADGGVALNQGHGTDGNGQLFGHELRLCGQHALAEIALARIGRHLPVRRDRDP